MLPKSDRTEFTISSKVITGIIEGILKDIDYICKQEHVEYFVFSDLLRYTVHYEGLLPYNDEEMYDVGFLRDDYEKFIHSLSKYADERNFIVDNHPVWDEEKKYQNRVIRIGREHTIDCGDLKLTEEFFVRLSPFDKVPEPIDTRRAFYRTMKRANVRHNKTMGCRVFLEGATEKEEKRGKKFHQFLWDNIRYRLRSSKKSFRDMHFKATKYDDSDSPLYQRVVVGRSAVIREDQLFPLQRLPFGDITVPAPHDYTPWTEIYRGEQKEQIQQIQKIDLKILAEFDRVCRKIGVGYFICGGSMLGYVRHGGFIPWDDDVDCGMLRSDYNKFLAEAPKYLDTEKFFLQTRDSDPTIPYLFSKIRMNNSLYMTEYNELRKFHKGICMDIFPFDYIPEGKREQREHLIRVKQHARVHHFIANRQKGDPPKDDKPKTLEDKWYRMLGNAHRRLFRMFPLKITQKYYDDFVTQYNDKAEEKGLTMVGSFVPTYTWAKLDTLLPYRTVDFEGVQAMIPNKPEKFLEMQYGDYMTPPPSHLQIGHDLVAWSADLEDFKKELNK
ncbi:MAG: LicD family protein [Anaerovoracaceae bacterium]|jgi:lipopolysaccharide cholinephosphotransferase